MITEPRIPDPDGFYAAWLQAHEDLDETQSADLNTRLVLLLANQCGDQAVLLACIAAARESGGAHPVSPSSHHPTKNTP